MTTDPSQPLRRPLPIGQAVILAYGLGLWLLVLHHVEGGNQGGEPSLLLHTLRDSTLALPAVILAVAVASSSAHRLLSRLAAPPPLARAFATATVALAAGTATAAGVAVHAWLFGAPAADDVPVLVHILRDALLALPAALLLAAATAVRPQRARLAVAALAVAVLAGVAGGGVEAADVDPGNPCPTTAPIKRFDVQTIDVDIPLNRFGDHDPAGKMYVLAGRISDVRGQEASRNVSTGLHDDPIQPLVIRANQGDCLEVRLTNNASGGSYGVHIDGLSFEIGSSGDAVGVNASSAVPRGASRTYRFYVPSDRRLEGAHYLRPGPGLRDAVSHGLFGVVVVEPPGSTYLHPRTLQPLESGWEAIVVPGTGKSFREYVKVYHEIGNEQTKIKTRDGGDLPQVDPLTESYRPGSRALNYRSEPFSNRLKANPHEEALGYGSYTFGDPATPMPRAYLGDPTKVRLIHAGSEMFHVHHLHGGGIRWRFNPKADTTYDYQDTGLNKRPSVQRSPSMRLDSQAIGPGESYNLEIEGGAGGVQQAAGDFLYHCHIGHHYVSGMWSFWRVFDTRQPDLSPLPDRQPPAQPVDSAALIGRTMPDGTSLTATNLDAWIRPQLPPPGVPKSDEDASVWNWTIDRSDPSRPIYLGEPEDTRPWPNLPNLVPGHPGSFLVDQLVGNRPKILFNPINGRPAYPLLRPHIGRRVPFSPNGHSGAPWLGERGDAAPSGLVDAFARRSDGLCPAGSPLRRFNVVAVELSIPVTRTTNDPGGKIFVLAQDKADVLAGRRPAQPLAIRANAGDCVAHTFVNEQSDPGAFNGFSKVNMHVHHVQFDVQASDGVISGMAFEQSVRPYRVEDPQLAAAAAAGATTLRLTSVAKFQPEVWIGVGLGTEGIEIRQIKSIDAVASTVTLTRPLSAGHAAGEWAGTEFVQYRWYPDVVLDNVFWHDHVDGVHTWRHGLVGQIVVEPPGSTYHDPVTGAEVASGTIVDVRTGSPLVPGVVDGSFRELVLWTINENPVTDSTLNLRAEPWAQRLSANGDSSLLFSSYTHGDPVTPILRGYPGDPVVFRYINGGPDLDTVHVDGHRFWLEPRYSGGGGAAATPMDTLHGGISERFTMVLEGGAGGPLREPGDYLFTNGVERRFRDGAWGLVRVLGVHTDTLQPLPGTTPPPAGPLPAPTGGRPPQAAGPGDPCPVGAPTHAAKVTAVDLPTNNSGPGNNNAVRAAFVRSEDAAAARAGSLQPEPFVLHVAAGECVIVQLTNGRQQERVSFHAGELLHRAASSGINAGFTPEQTVAPGETRTFRLYADSEKIESALVSDFGSPDSALRGLYGAIVVAPAGSKFTDPGTGAEKDVGTQVDVHVPGAPGYRDFTVLLADQDPRIGQSVMPYPTQVQGPALLNYRSAPRPDSDQAFSIAASGEPRTPIFRAYRDDQVRVHALVAPGSEQMHVFALGGFSWPLDPRIDDGEEVESRGLGPRESVDAHVSGGAGGRAAAVGDFVYGDLRRPFTLAGMWGLQRVLAPGAGSCALQPVGGLACGPPLDGTGPTIALTAPGAGTVLSGAAAVSAEAADNVGVVGVQFRVDGGALGAEDTAAPFSLSLDTRTLADGPHTLSAVARDEAGNATGSPIVSVTVDNTAPSVSVTSPAAGSTVLGTVTVAATASDAAGIAGVRFKLDGAYLGAEDTTAPYEVTWETATAANGPHTLSAVARDTAGNVTTSAEVGVTVSNTAAPPPGLVAAYSFDAAGATVADASGNGNTGAVSGATWTATGRHGGALSFDGLDDWVTVADAPSLDLTTGMTLEAWVSPDAVRNWPTVLMKEQPGQLVYALYANSDASFFDRPSTHAFINGFDRNIRGGSTLPTGGWTHLAATYDGNIQRLFVDGVQVATLLSPGSIGVSGGPLRIGGNAIWGEFLDGRVDDVRVYNRALSATEIAADMAAPVS